MVVKRGDIFYADLSKVEGEIGGIRPVVIIQNDVGNTYGRNIIVSVMTTSIHMTKLPTHVKILAGNYGLTKDSTIMLDQIRTIDKRRLKKKIGTLQIDELDRIDLALNVSLNLNGVSNIDSIEREDYISELKLYIENMNKPLIITEGKTDSKLIEVAWRKLYPDKKMFFECKASGLEYEESKRQGNANTVRRTIEYLSNITERPIIGLFDNDREGNEQFKGLSKEIFEKYNVKNDIRKHKTRDVFGMLLPVPDYRKIFVTNDDITQRYFVIEHYFTDNVLKQHSMYGNNILGTCVFKINNRKAEFSNEAECLEPKEFSEFDILFSRLEKVLKIK